MAKQMLELTDVSLELSGKLLLENINFQLEAAEIMTIIGPNGAGKTTLLRVALGLQKPTSGQVVMQPAMTVGYMPQKLHLDPTFPLTVKRFMSLGVQGRENGSLGLLEEVGAAHVYDASMHNLSGGEMQRVMLARALVREPDLLVMDEPVQGVDVHGQVELYELIGRIRTQRGCAMLMVSHDLHLVMAATDRVLCLNRHICCSGPPEAVTNDPAYLEMFGARAVKQLAIYVHDQNHQHDHCSDCVHRRPHAG